MKESGPRNVNHRVVVACVKNTGGADCIYPVLAHVKKLGFDVDLFGVPPASKSNTFAARHGEEIKSAQEILERFRDYAPDVLLTTMCTEGGPGRDLVPMLRKLGTKVVAVQDYWGGELALSWKNPKYRPDATCVNDTVGKDLILKAWPDYDPEKIVVTGYPTLSRFSMRGLNGKPKEFYINQLRKLSGDRPVILFAGQNQRSGAALMLLVRMLNTLGPRPKLIVREHPRMRTSAPDEVPVWEEALKLFEGELLQPDDTWTTEMICAGADLTISMYSTVLISAAAMCKPCIAMLDPDIGGKRFQEAFGGLMDEFPLVTLGCCYKSDSDRQLRGLINNILYAPRSRGNPLLAAQMQHLLPDAQSALQIAEVINKLTS